MTADRPTISHYRIESPLGTGGMGEVYLAHDTLLHRRVAIKRLHPGLARDPEARRRFLNEGRAAATLSHPSIAVVFEVGAEGEDLFLALEYVPGETLKDLAATGPVPWPDALRMTLEILGALEEAHAKGILHRDIKSANIKRTPEGRIKVLDFGLAKILGTTTLTRRDMVVGTAAYMSPQQVCGEDLDARTDLFSLGVVLYELLTGRMPFQGDHDVAVAHAILHEDPITVRELAPEVPAELEHIVFKALMKNPAARYQTAGEMAEDLVRFQEHDRRRRAGGHEELDLIATSDVYEVRRERFHAPLVGRETAAARVAELHAEARRGQGATIVLSGEAGVGKTRLLEELSAGFRREGSRVLFSSCLYGGSAGSYYPVADALRQYFALRGVTNATTLQSFVVDRAPRLGGSLPVLNRFLRFAFATNGPTSEEELWEMLDQLVLFISQERPLVLVVEDLQWADQGTLRIFHFMARNAPRRRLLLVGTFRPEETVAEGGLRQHSLVAMLQLLGREERVARLDLPRLGREHVSAILNELYPRRSWGQDFPDLLFRETEGNPFFLVEILKLLVSEKVLVQEEGDAWRLGTSVERISIPEKVYDVVMRRLSRLGPKEREILEMGAVEGAVFHSGTILRGLRIERMKLLKTLQFLEQVHHLIHATGPQYHFDHSKIREILYDSIPPELRLEYHTVVGQFLRESYGESEAHAGIIAHNLLAAGLEEEALPFLMRAATAAGRLFSHGDAVHYLDRAEAVLHDLHPGRLPVERMRLLAEIHQRRADHEYAAGHYPAAIASYESALDLARRAGEEGLEADLLRSIGRMQYLLGHHAESRRHYDDAIRHYTVLQIHAREAGDHKALAHAARELGKLHFFRGEMDRSRECIEAALEIARRTGDERLVAAALNNLAGIHYQRGDLAAALDCHRESLALRERLGDEEGLAQSHKNIGITHYWLGEMDAGAHHLESALQRYRGVGDRRGEAVTLRHLGNLLFESGDHEGARRHWEASLFLCRELGGAEDLCSCLNNLGLLHFEQARHATAQRLLREGIELAATAGARTPLLAFLHHNLADVYLDLDRLADAEAELKRAEEVAREVEATKMIAEVRATQAKIAAERGDVALGRERAREALETAEPTGEAESLVHALRASAEVEFAAGAHRAARDLARQARDVAHWARATHEEVHAGLTLVQALLGEGSRAEAGRMLDELEPIAREHGYRTLVAHVHGLRGQALAGAGDLEGAAAEYRRAAEEMGGVLEGLADEDRRYFLHHPEWRAAVANLLETLQKLGRREEALAVLERLGAGARDLEELPAGGELLRAR